MEGQTHSSGTQILWGLGMKQGWLVAAPSACPRVPRAPTPQHLQALGWAYIPHISTSPGLQRPRGDRGIHRQSPNPKKERKKDFFFLLFFLVYWFGFFLIYSPTLKTSCETARKNLHVKASSSSWPNCPLLLLQRNSCPHSWLGLLKPPSGTVVVLRLKQPHLQSPGTSVALLGVNPVTSAQQHGESQVHSCPLPVAQSRGAPGRVG